MATALQFEPFESSNAWNYLSSVQRDIVRLTANIDNEDQSKLAQLLAGMYQPSGL